MKRIVTCVAVMLAPLLASAQPVATNVSESFNQSYYEVVAKCGVSSFSGDTEPTDTCQGSAIFRQPFGRFSLFARFDTEEQSGLVNFDSFETWRTGHANLGSGLALYDGPDYEFGIAATYGLQFAITDTVGKFGKELTTRPQDWGGGLYVRVKKLGAYYYVFVGRYNLANEDRLAIFGTARHYVADVAGKPVAFEVDMVAPIETGPGGVAPHTWRIATNVVVRVIGRK